MKPLLLLAACSLLAPQARVAASDYPPPTGPYRTPATLESLADQARAVLETLDSSPAEVTDQPERHHPEPTTTHPQLTSAHPERSAPPGGESGLTPASIEREAASPLARRNDWGQADYSPPDPEPRAFPQAGTSCEPDQVGISARRTADSRSLYAQAILPYSQPDTRRYATPEQYTGASPDTGYYGAAPGQQGYRYAGSEPSGYYATEGYRETPGMRGAAERSASPQAWDYYPQDDYTQGYSSSSAYPQPPLGQQARDRTGQPASQPPYPQAGRYLSDPSSSYPQDPLAPLFSGMAGGTGGYDGVDAYSGSYRPAAPFTLGQPGYTPAYAGVAAQPPGGVSLPSHKASYAQDSWPYGSGSSPQTVPSSQWAGQYRAASEGLASDYPAYQDGYVAPHEADRFAAPGYLPPGDAPLRYRQNEPAGSNVYYGDYRFAPPAPGRNGRHQDSSWRGAGTDRYPGSGTQPDASVFRNAGQAASSVTGPGGRVYRYRPLQEAHSGAPHAQTWESESYPPPQDYRDQDYLKDRSREYRDRW